MTAYATLVNTEALVLDVLRDAGLTNVHAERINTGLPFLLVEAAGGPPLRSDNPGWVQTSDVQLTSWHTTKAGALNRFNTADRALRSYVRTSPNRPQGTLVRVVVPRPIWSPDDDLKVDGNPAPRYFAVATVTVHP